MWQQREDERLRKQAWQERRRSPRSTADSAIDALYVQLFGNPMNPDDHGAIGTNTRRIARLERLASWIAALLVTTLLAVVTDLIVRLAHP